MASPLERMIAGFTVGSTGYAVDQLKARQAQEADLKKAQLLESLRRDTATYLADYEERMRRGRGDRYSSGSDGDDFVTRNDRGEELSRRALTDDERYARDAARQKNELDAASTRADIDYKRDSLDLRRAEMSESRAERAERRAERQEDRAARSGTGNMDVSDPYSFGSALQSLESAAVSGATKDGVPATKISQLAAIVAQQESASARKEGRRASLANARGHFLRGLERLYDGVEGTGNEKAWSSETFRSKAPPTN